jgi:hypothetical protein
MQNLKVSNARCQCVPVLRGRFKQETMRVGSNLTDYEKHRSAAFRIELAGTTSMSSVILTENRSREHLSGGPATVNKDGVSGDEPSSGRGQKYRCPGYVHRLADTMQSSDAF